MIRMVKGKTSGRALHLCWAVVLALPALAAEGPRPPCMAVAGSPVPAFAVPGAPLIIGIWKGAALDNAPPSECMPWTAWKPSLLVAVASSFFHKDDADVLLSRFAAVSALSRVRYWSITDQTWNRLVIRANALEGPDPARPRADFTAGELKSGHTLYYTQQDNRSSQPVVYNLHVVHQGPDRLVVDIENVTAVRFFLPTLFAPGTIHTRYYLVRLRSGVWGYYGLSGVREGTFPWTGGPVASYINRAVAMYRHLAGIPTDRAPPAAPENR